jgi:phosphoribosylanthranilate isomerase
MQCEPSQASNASPVAEIKFCGLTRAEDAAFAGELGAAYLGVIFAGGPRLLSAARAAEVLDGCATTAQRVGVFGQASVHDIGRVARQVRLAVVQLHADPTAATVRAVRDETGAKVWAVVRVTDALPPGTDELLAAADALLIDARVPGSLGGNGVTVDWSALRPALSPARGGGRIVLAGGLMPENVRRAVATLRPHVVDVSSGVESAPGIKDHARMRAFAAAVAGATQEKR